MSGAGTDWSRGWPAPAKLNLFLHILGRRPDGYHELETAFQLLDRGDELAFRVRADGAIRRLGGLAHVPEAEDLVVRAARLLQQAAGTRLGADIHLDKRLPDGGGLGGGSSNAATVLRALNRLWGAGLSEDALAELGLKLGADVPVFVRGHTAWAQGVGEQLTPIETPPHWFLVVHPGCAVSTAAVFSAEGLTRDSAPSTISALRAGRVRNDCEAWVRARYRAVDVALVWLSRFAPARLTGTGACVFAAFAEEAQAQQALDEMPAAWQGIVAQGVAHSPLLQRLQAEQDSAGRSTPV
ncbi:4-diphosphocytidyl-2-C-methyl-D-erythritol kinase [Alkalispirillum mobile]|uniref:4-diphosphocytidyl-2-C-methyl-D-erythritol kinase n=1 Tax=Alkalispirillum mobile TaxID=85925 RepID=A0A498CAD1_9GAMM|nr:4-(cytidine 5'-diphospho)-2-C-methyl-D-erythritol kinase [Alkalispirillum mobile]RLK51476.1 4-diphosphocytidyl-2-C-methyl-D-erythritol kinase [Alkalispirillum mobile]